MAYQVLSPHSIFIMLTAQYGEMETLFNVDMEHSYNSSEFYGKFWLSIVRALLRRYNTRIPDMYEIINSHWDLNN